MKRSGYKPVISLLFVQLVLLLSVSAYAADLDKKIKKEYDAAGIELLKINNRYGDVEIVSSGNNKINIVVTVQVSLLNDSKAERLLSMIDVEFSENDNTIEARTVIDRNFSMENNGPGRGFSIDYMIEMPASMNLDLENKYGDFKAGVLSGHVDIRIKYGSMYIDALNRGNIEPLNSITAEYLRVGNISDAGWLELNLRYVGGDFFITNAQALLINSRYSTDINIENVSSVVIDSKYDKFNIENVNNIVAESGYTGYKIDNLVKKLDIETKYGSLEVGNVVPGFELIRANFEYSSVRLSIDDDASYNLKCDTRYTSCSINDSDLEIRQRIEEMHSKYLEATVGGKAGTKSEVIINSRYGSVRID